uniref:RING-type domain-containing protein n=1 Tax=Anopheles atroparvus TaxID=41427 RepID=A0AAG5CNY8_ANOAO
MSDTKATADHHRQTTDSQQASLERAVETTSQHGEVPPSLNTNSTPKEGSTAATIVPTDISVVGAEHTSGNSVEIPSTATSSDQASAAGAVPPTSASTAIPAVHGSSVERQTSVGSADSTAMPSGTSGGNAASSSVDRTRSGNEGSSGRGSNFSNDMFNDILSLMQQARHPSSLFSSDRRGLFLHSGRSHGTGSSTPPIAIGNNGSIGNTSSSDVVIDVDGNNSIGGGSGAAGVGSLRSSHNELYPMSNSSSSASTGIRPFLWVQGGDDNAAASGSSLGGRSAVAPNFNYNHHHHHHHFHNHQPLSLHQQHHTSGSAAGIAAATSQQSPMSTGGGIEDGAILTGSGDPVANGGVTTPSGSLPPGATRSNSVSSNHPNDEATVHEALNQIPEARAMMDTFARYTPLLLILVAKLCYDHLDGIMHFLLLLMTFYHANWVVRQEISKQKQRRIIVLMRELIIISVALLIFGLVIEWKSICLVILFMPDHLQPESLKSLLFSVCITDLILKLITIIIKIIVTLMPPRVVDYKSRGKVYLMIESLSQLYRAAAPIQPWLIFLFESYSGSEKMVGVILSAVYIVAKSTDLLDRIKFCRRSFIKLLQKTSYGTVPTKEQLQACGGQCSICHDNFNSPVLLECNHIFCELCVGTWFDREQTCPLCRAKIVDDPSYRDGATTFFLQLY